MNLVIALQGHSSISSAPRSWSKSSKKRGSSSKSGFGIKAMRSWSNRKQEIRQAIRSDRLDLTDLLEKLAAAGLRFSDLLRGQTFRLRVAGQSMSTVLWNGDQITVVPASPASLQEGDVILFHQSGQLICHRVVAIQETEAGPRLITKGDAATGCGETIQPEQVLGKVVAVARRWPWSHRGRWVGTLARWVDRGSEWIAELIALGLQCLHEIGRAHV